MVTRNPRLEAPGCDVAGSLREAVEMAAGDEVRIIGGGQLYAEALPMADRMVLTRVDCEPEADTWCPEWNDAQWNEVARRDEAPDDKNPHAYSVFELKRRLQAPI